jgi:exopolysaccharide production protein ExoZ
LTRPRPLKTYLSLQYLRAFAALAVVLFHACQWADINFDIGAGGVDVFFIISGFLMWRITEDPRVTAQGFLLRRIGRVAPLYWIVTLALAGLAVAAPHFIWQVRPEPAHVLLSLLFVPHLDPVGIPFPLLPPGWTLNYEAVLYLVFTASLLGPRRWRFALVLGALAAIPVIGLLYVPLFPLFANPMMLEFAAGVMLAKLLEISEGPTLGAGWSLIALGLVSFATLRLLGIHSDFGRWALWGVPAVMIVTGALGVEARGGLPRSDMLKHFGDASYAIYLGHWPIILVIGKFVGPERGWLFVISVSLAALIGGLALHYALEKPLLRLARRSLRAPEPVLSVP